MNNSDTFTPEVNPVANTSEIVPEAAPKASSKAAPKKQGSLPKVDAPLATVGTHVLPNGLTVVTN